MPLLSVDPPTINPPHRYPLRSRTWANHIVEAVGGGAVAFQGVIDLSTGKTQGYTQLIHGPNKGTWTTELSNDIGRLAQVVGNRIKGKNNILFIHRSEIPAGKRVAYGQLFVPVSPKETKTHRVRITVGSNRISYKDPTNTQCAGITTTKILINSVLSTILSIFMSADMHDLYYNTPMVYFEYRKPPLRIFPQ